MRMKSISLYQANGSWLTRLHPFTKLFYLVAAVSVPLIQGSLAMFLVTIFLSLLLLHSAHLVRKAVPLLAFSFTIILTIVLIQSLFNHANVHVLFSIGFLHFYREGLLYAAHIGGNILNMLLAFAILVLTTAPEELVKEYIHPGIQKLFDYDMSRNTHLLKTLEVYIEKNLNAKEAVKEPSIIIQDYFSAEK